jgi:hypothetical protein
MQPMFIIALSLRLFAAVLGGNHLHPRGDRRGQW